MRGRVLDGSEALGPPLAVVPDADYIHQVPWLEGRGLQIRPVDEHDTTSAFDPAIAVVETVDGRVELVVGPHRLKQKVAFGYRYAVDGVHRKTRFAGRSRERPRVRRRTREREASRLGYPLLEGMETRHHAADMLPHERIVAGHLFPADVVAEDLAADRADDRNLAPQSRRRRLEASPRSVNHAHRVLDGHELLRRAPPVTLATSETRQDQRLRAVVEVGPVELGRNVDRQSAVRHRRRRYFGVGSRSDEVPSEGEEDVDVPVAHCADRFDGIETGAPGRVESELGAEGVQERIGHPFPDAHRPVTLHVAVPADGCRSGAGTADVESGRPHRRIPPGSHRAARPRSGRLRGAQPPAGLRAYDRMGTRRSLRPRCGP